VLTVVPDPESGDHDSPSAGPSSLIDEIVLLHAVSGGNLLVAQRMPDPPILARITNSCETLQQMLPRRRCPAGEPCGWYTAQ
jgi:hypothetical protein